MTLERIKQIQQETAYPESVSVQQALLKVWNECEQNKSLTRKIKKEKYTAVESIDHLAYLLNGCFRDLQITYNSKIKTDVLFSTYLEKEECFAISKRRNGKNFDLFIPKKIMHKNSYAKAILEKRLTVINF